MVITSHPLATRLAAEVVRRGGNACDAALCACSRRCSMAEGL
jgi:gamma-glutamyltranspeptidase